jgi:hypothetical protein
MEILEKQLRLSQEKKEIRENLIIERRLGKTESKSIAVL